MSCKSIISMGMNNEDKEKKRIEKSLDEIGNVLLTSIDWNEFSVVETITFAVDELLLLGVRSQDEINSSFERNEVKNNDRSSSVGIQNGQGDGSIPAQPSSNVIFDDDDDDDDDGLNVLNNANYIPRVASTSVTNLPNAMVDPISGRIIPVEQISDHMRIQLMDPKWIEQQKRFINKQHDTGFAEGISIADSLKSFARQRGDIFGSGSLNEVDGCEDNVTNSYDSRIDDENDARSDGTGRTLSFTYTFPKIDISELDDDQHLSREQFACLGLLTKSDEFHDLLAAIAGVIYIGALHKLSCSSFITNVFGYAPKTERDTALYTHTSSLENRDKEK